MPPINYNRYPKPSHRKTRASKAWRMWRNLGAGLHPGNLWAGLQRSRYFGPPRLRLLSPRAAHIINSNLTQTNPCHPKTMRDSWPTTNVEKSLDVSSADLIAHNINSNPSTWKDTCIGGENDENDDPVALDIKIPSIQCLRSYDALLENADRFIITSSASFSYSFNRIVTMITRLSVRT